MIESLIGEAREVGRRQEERGSESAGNLPSKQFLFGRKKIQFGV